MNHGGGYLGVVTALLAFYLSAVELINETHGRIVLPIGTAYPRVTVSMTIEEEFHTA